MWTFSECKLFASRSLVVFRSIGQPLAGLPLTAWPARHPAEAALLAQQARSRRPRCPRTASCVLRQPMAGR